MAIPFIRQLPANAMFPKGRRLLTEYTLGRIDEELARQFIAMGGAYVCEILPSGEARIAACLQINGAQKDVEERTCPNGPEIRATVEDLVRASVKHVPAPAAAANTRAGESPAP